MPVRGHNATGYASTHLRRVLGPNAPPPLMKEGPKLLKGRSAVWYKFMHAVNEFLPPSSGCKFKI
jgi:hypothetical protein